MCQPAPTKRRKLRGELVMQSAKVPWPANVLPVEIFALIISYLPRSSIQSMRLVNAEFEEKVAQVLFRAVVVPFKPELYGISSEAMPTNDAQGSIMLQDDGMRVFQGFGRWIRKFAMSFEIDHGRLRNPPTKSDQEAVTSFWGIYRWPFRRYNRYTLLEGLEQTADETRSMARALRFISGAEELGLSIDGGLGWLCGPDVNLRVSSRADKLPVFSSARFIPEPKVKQTTLRGEGLESHSHIGGRICERRRILEEAGYEGQDLDHAVRMLLESEGILLQAGGPDGTLRDTYEQGASTRHGHKSRTSRRDHPNDTSTSATALLHVGLSDILQYQDAERGEDRHGYDNEDNDDGQEYTASRMLSLSNGAAKTTTAAHPLKPNDLSSAQRELLLEMEWAQSAFMQSWAIAVIDNTSTFHNVRKLTISRLPHRHLAILCRKDFWKSLPSLNSFSLAVDPDWREVRKETTSWVQDNRVAPSQSLPGVYKLLSEYVSRSRTITSLHFEWLCGGEHAPGIFARNQLVLAAPAVPEAMDMVNRTAVPPVLSLPFIEHLSLKNCWISPHIMHSLLYPMKAGSLQSLSLESVSLTAIIPVNAQPNPVPTAPAQNPQMAANIAHHHAAHAAPVNQLQNMNNIPAIVGWQAPHNMNPPFIQPTAAQMNENELPVWLQTPRSGSWPELIDGLSPSTTLADIRFQSNLGPQPVCRVSTRLKKLVFESCGYVHLPLDFDQSSIDQPQAGLQRAMSTTRRTNDIESYMMKPLESTLGTIVNFLGHAEKTTLENVWNLTIGWDASKFEAVLDAQLDGIVHAGQGRFRGSVSRVEASTFSSRHR